MSSDLFIITFRYASEANRMEKTLYFYGDPEYFKLYAAFDLKNDGILPCEYQDSAKFIIAASDPLKACKAIENAMW